MIHREHALQRGVMWFVQRAIAVEHVFACHDRAKPTSEHSHAFEAARGLRSGWPDTELALDGGRTFRCELKKRGGRLIVGSEQHLVIRRLADIGHPTAWADSVMAYGQACERWSVPLRANWRHVATLADEMVAADIRTQEAKQAAKDAQAEQQPMPRVRRKRTRPTAAQIARVERARRPT